MRSIFTRVAPRAGARIETIVADIAEAQFRSTANCKVSWWFFGRQLACHYWDRLFWTSRVRIPIRPSPSSRRVGTIHLIRRIQS